MVKNDTKLTIKSEEKECKFWKSCIDIAEKVQKDEWKKTMERERNFFKGKHYADSDYPSRDPRVVVNYCYANVKTIIPQMYFQDPHFYFTAEQEKYKKAQELVEEVVNNVYRVINCKKQIKRIALDYLVTAYGVGKIGWHTKFVGKALENEQKHTEFVKDERPYFIRLEPEQVLFDPEKRDIESARYVVGVYNVPLYEAKESYPQIKEEWAKAYFEAGGEATSTAYKEVADQFKRIKIYEVHDLVDRKFIWVCKESDKILKKVDDPYKLEASNYMPFFVNDVPGQLYPLSEISQISDLNLELDLTRSQLMAHRKKSQRKILAEASAFANEQEKQKFLDGEDMQMVILNDGAIKAGQILVVNASMMSAEFYNVGQMIADDIHVISAIGRNQHGVEDNKEKTAYEASVQDRNANMRNSDRLDVMGDYSVALAKNLLCILQKFAGKENEFFSEKKNEWIKWKKEDIAGEYKLRIDIGSTAKKNDEQERSLLTQLFPQVAGITDESGQVVNPREFLKIILKRYNIKDDEIDRIILSEKEGKAKQEQIRKMVQEEIMNMAQQQMTQQPAAIGGMPGVSDPYSQNAPGMEAYPSEEQMLGFGGY